MVIVDCMSHEFYIDGILKDNLDSLKQNVLKDYDAFLIVSGREGYGKSTIAAQVATYLDSSYDLSRCCFTAEQFIDAVEKAEKYEAIVFDETMGYLSSRGSMSKFNRALIKVMSEMRSKNLFVILCIPNFFELDRYPAMHRSVALIHCYKRGRFAVFNYSAKKYLYIKGKKFYSYYQTKPDFIGVFVDYFPYNLEEYEKKKQKAIFEWSSTRKLKVETPETSLIIK